MPGLLRLVLWPTVLTLAVSVARLALEVQGIVTTQSGGGLSPLGISWLVFVFGAWFGWRLSRAGSRPRLRFSALFALLPLLAIVAAIALGFGTLNNADQTDAAYEQLRGTLLTIILVAVAGAAFCFVVWTRMALVMLVYAIPARLTVIGITWLAKTRGWDTHYTKFGPAGIEREPAETIYAASVAQLGFWVAFTIVGGVLAGTIAARLFGPRQPQGVA